jgi:hypothetical protein
MKNIQNVYATDNGMILKIGDFSKTYLDKHYKDLKKLGIHGLWIKEKTK